MPAWRSASSPDLVAPVWIAGSRPDRAGSPGAHWPKPRRYDRRLAQVARALGRRHDHRDAAVRHQAAVVEVQRLDDPARRVVVGDRHRRAHLGARVLHRPLALPDRDRPELVVGRAEQVHVPLQRQGVHRVGGAEVAVGQAQPGEARGGGALSAVGRLGDRTAFGQRRVGVDARHDGRLSALNRLRGVLEHRAGRRPEGAHRAHQREVREAERELQRRGHLAGVVGVDEQAVDVGGLEAGVVERERERVGREVGRGAAVDLAHVGDAEAGDGGGRAQRSLLSCGARFPLCAAYGNYTYCLATMQAVLQRCYVRERLRPLGASTESH